MLESSHDIAALNQNLIDLDNLHKSKTQELFEVGKMIEDASKELIELNGKYKRIRFEMKGITQEMNNTKVLIRAEKI